MDLEVKIRLGRFERGVWGHPPVRQAGRRTLLGLAARVPSYIKRGTGFARPSAGSGGIGGPFFSVLPHGSPVIIEERVNFG
jgi:hypothetical protein